MQITYERVRELFAYNGHDLVWENSVGKKVKKGSVAGYIKPKGYRYIGINNKQYYAHLLIWMYHNGYFPENQIDHINRDKADNRIENLREVSQSCNIRNCGNRKDNSSGVKGVCFHKKNMNWYVYIAVNRKICSLGSYGDFNEAVLSRLAAEQCLDWNRCDPNSPANDYAIKNNLFKPPFSKETPCQHPKQNTSLFLSKSKSAPKPGIFLK